MYLILKFWTTNSWKLGKYSGESELHNYPALLILQSTQHWPRRQGSRQVVHGVQPGTRSLVLVCTQRTLHVPSLERETSKMFVVPIPNSSGITWEHAAKNTPGSAVSWWHGRRDSGSSCHSSTLCPSTSHSFSPPRPIKLMYLSAFQSVCSWLTSSFQQLLLFQRQLAISS